MGKSSSVNSLMGKEVAPVGDWLPTTMGVTSYDSDAFGIKFTVIDTPGLCDDLEEEGKDYKYLKRIRAFAFTRYTRINRQESIAGLLEVEHSNGSFALPNF